MKHHFDAVVFLNPIQVNMNGLVKRQSTDYPGMVNFKVTVVLCLLSSALGEKLRDQQGLGFGFLHVANLPRPLVFCYSRL